MRRKAREILSALRVGEGALTADFQREYHMRLVDAVNTLPDDELLNLINWLRADSAYMTLRRANNDALKARSLMGWDVNTDVLFQILNLSQHQIYMTAQAASSKKLAPPEPLKHPLAEKSRSGNGDASAFAKSFLASARKNNEVDPPNAP